MNAEAHAVDNLGTKALVDAAKKSGVKKIVMVSLGQKQKRKHIIVFLTKLCHFAPPRL